MGGLVAAAPSIMTYLGYAATAYGVYKWATAPDQVQDLPDTLSLSTAPYGNPLSFLVGRERVGGTCVWTTDLIPKEHSESAKGGPSIITYTFRVSFAVAFTGNQVRALRKLWFDSVLVYDISDDGGKTSNVASVEGGLNFVFYPGSGTQPVDPTIEADLGVGNTPAYRGRSLLVINDLLLTKWGNKRPTSVSAELITDGANTETVGEIIHTPLLLPEGIPSWSSAVWDGTKVRVTWWGDGPLAGWPYQGMSIQDWDIDTLLEIGYQHLDVVTHSSATHYRMTSDVPGQFKWYVRLGVNEGYLYPSNSLTKNSPAGLPEATSNVLRSGNDVYYTLSAPNDGIPGEAIRVIWQKDYGSGTLLDQGDLQFGRSGISSHNLHLSTSADSRYLAVTHYSGVTFAGGIDVYFVDRGIYGSLSVAGGIAYPVGTVEYIGVWDDVFYSFTATHINGHSMPDGTLIETYEMTEVVRAGSYRDNHMISKNLARVRETIWYIGGSLEVFQVTLAEAITRLCAVKNIHADQIDVSDLIGVLIDGITVSTQSTLETALRPLAMAYLLDMYSADGKLVFTRSGKAPTVVMTDDDLVSDVEMMSPQEHERPAKVTINYRSYANDYNPGSQDFYEYILSDQEKSVAAGMVLSDDYAAQLAEVTWLISNYGVRQFKWSVSQHFDDVTPSDVIDLTWDGDSYQVKLDSVDSAPGGEVMLAGTADREDLYESWAVGGTSGVPSTVPGSAKTKFLVVDAPAFIVGHDYPGVYVVGWSTVANWGGAAIMRSSDQGQNWQLVENILQSATVGIMQTELTEWTQPIIQDGGSFDVYISYGDAPSSVDRDGLLAGENSALVGQEGRWEVVSFQTVTDLGNGIHRCSINIRGRLGTEQNTDSHAVGDQFILLNRIGMIRAPLDAAYLGTDVWFAAVPDGRTIDEAVIQVVSPTRMGVKPYAPTNIRVWFDGTESKWLVKWNRRARISGPWADFVDPPLRDVPELYLIQRHRAGDVPLELTSNVPGVWIDDLQKNDVITIAQVSPNVGAGDVASFII